MTNSNFIDKKMLDKNIQALKELTENSKILTSYWYRLNLEPMTAELYQSWLNDRELIFTTYQKESSKDMNPLVWAGLDEKIKRPKLDEGKTAGRFERVFSMAARHSQPFDGIRVIVSTSDIEFKDGQPVITDEKLKDLERASTLKITAKQKDFVESLQDLCNAFDKVQTESKKLFGTSLNISQLPVNFDGESASIDMSKLFDLVTIPELLRSTGGRISFAANTREEPKPVKMPGSFHEVTV